MTKSLAFLVHVLTASGAAFALLALIAAADARWADMFIWLFAAQVVDGIDGPIARKLRVRTVLPNWSGDSLDFVIDYATYVLIPAFALARTDFIDQPYAMIAAIVIVISGGLYFADERMKTCSNAFRGFPAVWNGVIFYFFIVEPASAIGFATVIILAAGQFVPVEFIHPVRVASWRPFTLAVTAIWSVFAVMVILNDMVPTQLVQIMLIVTGLYLFAIGPALHYRRKKQSV